MKLTHIACKNAEPREKAYKLTDGGGLYLYVMPNGSKYWHFKYSYAGKEKRLALGVYPEISLQMAREKRLKARRLLDEGVDPGLEKKRMKYQRVLDANNTFKLIAEEWVDHNLGKWSKNHVGTVRRRLEMDNSIYFSAVMQCLSELKSEDAPDDAECKWARVFRQKCFNLGLDITAHSEYMLAQKLMKYPFALIDTYLFGDTNE